MKQLKALLLPVAALVVALSTVAFTLPQTSSSEIWFEVDPITLQPLDPNQGLTSPPGDCDFVVEVPCARSLMYPTQVDLINGTYRIKTGVDISTTYEDEVYKH